MSLVSKEEFIKTYKCKENPLKLFRQYKKVKKIIKKEPERSSYSIALALEIPRSRVRPWLSGSKPDFLRGLEAVKERGWIDLNFEDDNFKALNRLVAWVFSGGSISRGYSPTFSIEDEKKKELFIEIAEELDLDYRFVREDEEGRVAEACIKEDSTRLGRVLHILGAPVGSKSKKAEIKLPQYLKDEDCPFDVKESFLKIYLMNRATERKGKDIASLREERNKKYLTELKELIEEVLDVEATISEYNIYFSKRKFRELIKS